jgi:transcriptional regulator
MPRPADELLPGTLDLLILQSLASGPRHGYSIAKRIQQTSEGVLAVEEGSLYPALHRLEQRGLVSAEWGLSESNRRARFYKLSAAGRRGLSHERESWERVSGAIARVLRAPVLRTSPAPGTEARSAAG